MCKYRATVNGETTEEIKKHTHRHIYIPPPTTTGEKILIEKMSDEVVKTKHEKFKSIDSLRE